jgi:hypothetical protein
MAWTASAMFQAWPHMVLGNFGNNGYVSLEEDAIKVALYDNDITPDKDAIITSTGFNTGQWATSGNEVIDGDADWPTGGVALSGADVSDQGSGITMFDATDTTHANTVTLTNAYGCLVYDDATTAGTGGVVKQGITYHYFGGAQSVTTGTFTIVWHANGLFRITVS